MNTHNKMKDTTKMKSGLLFVYGTLMRRHHNHRIMQDAGGEFVCNAKTTRPYPLKIQGLPYLLNRPGEGLVAEGELYNVTTKEGWDRLDRLEGHPTFYHRGSIQVKDEAGNKIRVTTYFISNSGHLEGAENHACYE